MKRFILFCLLLMPGFTMRAQALLQDYRVKDSGFRIKLPAKPEPASMEYSPDSSKVYTMECLDSTADGFFHVGLIAVALKGIADANSDDIILSSYLNYLQTTFKVKEARGQEKMAAPPSHPSAVGLSDLWTDEDGDQWAISAWAGEKALAIVFVYGPGKYPRAEAWSAVGKSLRFPGDH